MTSNQLTYWANKEHARHNREDERIREKTSDQNLEGTKYSADSSKAASKYSADSSREASKYSADKNYQGQVYKADSKADSKMWDRVVNFITKLI